MTPLRGDAVRRSPTRRRGRTVTGATVDLLAAFLIASGAALLVIWLARGRGHRPDVPWRSLLLVLFLSFLTIVPNVTYGDLYAGWLDALSLAGQTDGVLRTFGPAF